MDKIPGKSFLSRYLVTIVTIPGIIGIHYGWYAMQQNRALVREDEQIEMPIVAFAKYLWTHMRGLGSTAIGNSAPTAASVVEKTAK